MTAEIAIINRTAVTLAADSAMTLSSGGSPDKIYNTADKIFELSAHDPLGLMIYNNLEFMGVPLDVAIKQFRSSSKCVPFQSVEKAGDAFFEFLTHDIGANEESQSVHVRRITSIIFAVVRNDFDDQIERLIETNPKGPPKGFSPHGLFTDIAKAFLAVLKKRDAAACFADVQSDAILERYKGAIQAGIKEYFGNLPLDDGDQELLLDIGATFLHRDLFSPSDTGFVFAGFGSSELFPSILAFRADGIIADRLKKRSGPHVAIDRVKVIAEIVPFAQREMVDRFLFGIDPGFEEAIPQYLADAPARPGSQLSRSAAPKRRFAMS